MAVILAVSFCPTAGTVTGVKPSVPSTTETEESSATGSSAVTLTVQLASARTALPLLRSTSWKAAVYSPSLSKVSVRPVVTS